MFQAPPKQPQAQIIATELVHHSNENLANNIRFQQYTFRMFWFGESGEVRSKEECNAILEALDQARPGQSAQLFASAKELVELILANDPQALTQEDWMPKYEYTVDPTTYSLRVV